MAVDIRLEQSARRFESWIKHDCLPLWLAEGFCSQNGGHYEKLTADGRVDLGSQVRVRVQARQAFSFAVAAQRGWCKQGAQRGAQLLNFAEETAAHPTKAGFVHLLDHHFEVLDSKQDLYDHAFFFLAYAWLYRVTGDRCWLMKADGLLAYIDAEFGALNGGWYEGDYAAPARRQNPHMHMFEAFMALYEASSQAKWLTRAGELFALFQAHFYHPETGILLEFFEDDWTPVLQDGCYLIEPGHLLEWVWLLDWYERLSGHDMTAYIAELYRNGQMLGLASQSPLLLDSLTVDATGHVTELGQSKRSWPMTELIKAHIVQARRGDKTAEAKAAETIDLLFDYFFTAKTAGAYIDQRGPNDEVADDCGQASTLYHLIVACAEVADYCNQQHIEQLPRGAVG